MLKRRVFVDINLHMLPFVKHMLCCVVLRRVVSVRLCYVVLFCVLLCYVMLCYVMLCCIVLCFVMLCYVVLVNVVLCYVLCERKQDYQFVRFIQSSI